MGPRRASGLALSPHLIRHYILGSTTQPEMCNSGVPTTNTRILFYQHKDPSRSHSRLWHKDHRSSLLPRYLKLDNMIPVIHKSAYAARSSPHSKRCNAPISMRTEWWISLHGGPIIKQRDLSSYKEIISCKSFSYVDLKYPHSQSQLRRV